MQVVAKTPHIRLDGEVFDELLENTESDWYRSLKPTMSPGENVRVYRELHGMTQAALRAKLGSFSRQNVSSMENGHRPISKAAAKRMARLFDVSVEKFI